MSTGNIPSQEPHYVSIPQAVAGFVAFYLVLVTAYVAAGARDSELAASLILMGACPITMMLLSFFMCDRMGWRDFPIGVWIAVFTLIFLVALISGVGSVAGILRVLGF